MAPVLPATRRRQHVFDDSQRWGRFTPRPDDIFIRDGRDALVSWANHRRKMRPEVIEALNAIAARDGVAPWPPVWDGDMDQLFDEWVDWGTSMEHLASWWPNRHEPFVLLVHYADLIRDLGGEMRRIADFLDVDIPTALWSEVVERCRFDAMKSQHEASA